MNASLLKSCKHLADFSTTDIIKNVGLYEPILVNTYSDMKKRQGKNFTLQISPDLKNLYALLRINTPLFLPCATCKKELAFNQLVDTDPTGKPHALTNIASRLPVIERNNFDPNRFFFFNETILWSDSSISDAAIQNINSECKKSIQNFLSFFLVELVCTLDSSHTIRCMFSLTQFKLDDDSDKAYREAFLKDLKSRMDPEIALDLSDADRENLEMGKLADKTLVLTKVGQYPSLSRFSCMGNSVSKDVLSLNYQKGAPTSAFPASPLHISFSFLLPLLQQLEDRLLHLSRDETLREILFELIAGESVAPDGQKKESMLDAPEKSHPRWMEH